MAGVVALAAFIAAQMRVSGARMPRRFVPLIFAAGLVVGIASLALLATLRSSHVSATLSQAHEFGVGVLISVIDRKASMDLHLVFHSVWMLVLIANCAGAWAIHRQQPDAALPPEPAYRTTVITSLAATAACLALNDAGVVAAALCSIFLWSYVAAAAEREHKKLPPLQASEGV